MVKTQMENSSKKSVLVLGAVGYLGTHLVKTLKEGNTYDVFTHSHSQPADYNQKLYNLSEVEELLQKGRFDYCINLLALTDVDYCENNFSEALKINYTPVKNLVSIIAKHQLKLKLVHISTDHVYNSNNAAEGDINLVNSYAITKYLADEVAGFVDAVVLRTNFFGSSASAKKSFTDWIDQAYLKGETISGFTDVYFSPVHYSTLIQVILAALSQFSCGVYNVGTREGFSKFEFIKKYFELKRYDLKQLMPAQYSNLATKIKRPLDMRMNVSKFEKTYSFKMRSLEEEIQVMSAP